MKLSVKWYADIGVDEREERKHLIVSARPTLEVLKGIVERRLGEIHRDRRTIKAYEQPNWPYMQADLVGAERELQSLLELLTLTEEP